MSILNDYYEGNATLQQVREAVRQERNRAKPDTSPNKQPDLTDVAARPVSLSSKISAATAFGKLTDDERNYLLD